jgi:hypothetical protein
MAMNPNMQNLNVDMVPELTRKHFEEALKGSRTSVTRSVEALFLGFGKIRAIPQEV